MRKILKRTLFSLLFLLLLFIGYFSIGSTKQAANISWGVNFSQTHASYLGLDWQKTYLALLNDVNVKRLKIATYWNSIEKNEGEYTFQDLDWQIEKASENEAEVFLAIGMRTPRWPECHIPEWAKELEKKEQQEKILALLEEIVSRYKDEDSIIMWQVENEPFFAFGECPWIDNDFLKKEIDLVKSLDDKNRPVAISDSGEWSFWIAAAKLGDKVSSTLHRKVYFKDLLRVSYPLRPIFYWRKAQLIKKFFDKGVFIGELQAEPWCSAGLSNCDLSEQKKTMDFEQFQKNIEFAKETGLNEFYLWGAEWIYWLKEKQDDESIWNELKKLFNKNL